jgi:hypothetical protein
MTVLARASNNLTDGDGLCKVCMVFTKYKGDDELSVYSLCVGFINQCTVVFTDSTCLCLFTFVFTTRSIGI